MRSSNPVLTGRGFARINQEVLDRNGNLQTEVAPIESRPASAPMSIDDVIIKTAALFAVLVTVGAVAWRVENPALALVGVVGGLILAMVNSFSQKVRPALVIAYAVFQGLALGTISKMYESAYSGIVGQAVVATACAFAGVLVA